MDTENDRVLKLIFPEGVPENLKNNPELFVYLQTLGTYKVDQLKKEQSRLQEKHKDIVEQTQDLAISNYKTFIHTAESSRAVFSEFQNTESRVNTLLEKLPDFSGKCEDFLKTTDEISEKRRLNTITLKKNSQLLEILEIPQLMERCIQDGRYEEALELASCVQKMGQKQGDIPVIQGIVTSVESLWHTMLVQLLSQLKTDLQLPKCLQIVGYLRRMQAFGNSELKLKFLQARNAWLLALLKSVPTDDAQQHLTKTIELTRIHLFNIITQYKAIFPDDDLPVDTKAVSSDGGRLFQAWLHRKIENFLETLEHDLEKGIISLDAVLGQCMYFGLSFSRVGADFRALMAPIFVRVILNNFTTSLRTVNQQFKDDLGKYTLINKIHSGLHNRKSEEQSGNDMFSPPETLLDFLPLASLCNGYLTAFNELRLCAPVAIANDVTKAMQSSLEFTSREVLLFYRQEQQAFTGNERENFVKFCSCFAYDLVPYLQRCIHAIFPQSTLTSNLGINLSDLQNEGISFLRQAAVLEPLKLLLPNKIHVILKQKMEMREKEAVEVCD